VSDVIALGLVGKPPNHPSTPHYLEYFNTC